MRVSVSEVHLLGGRLLGVFRGLGLAYHDWGAGIVDKLHLSEFGAEEQNYFLRIIAFPKKANSTFRL